MGYLRAVCVACMFFVYNTAFAAESLPIGEPRPPVVRMPAEIATLDWHKTMDLVSARVILNLMPGLASLNKTGDVVPALAKSWKRSKDGLHYTIEIRHDVYWSDGVKLTAQHFVDGFTRLLNPETAALGASYWWILKGARNFSTGANKDPLSLGLSARGDHILELNLEQPSEAFLPLLTHSISLPVRNDLLAKHGTDWMKPENLAVLGPYRLEDFKNQRITLVSNDRYYGKKPSIKRFQFLAVADDSTALNLFEHGDVDVVYQIPYLRLNDLRSKSDFKVFPHVRATVMAFNVTKPPFDQKLVRRAFALAADRESIAKLLDPGKATGVPVFSVLRSWIPEGVPFSNSKIELKTNPDLARKALADAGFPGGRGLTPIRMAFDARDEYRLIAERLQENWAKNLGVKVEIDQRDRASYLGQISRDAPQIFRFGLGSAYYDPDLFMNALSHGSSANFSKWNEPKYDQLIQRALESSNRSQRQKLYDQAQKLLIEDEAIMIPVIQEGLPALVSARLKNFYINGQSIPRMAEAELSEKAR